jgi:hypothetical protein
MLPTSVDELSFSADAQRQLERWMADLESRHLANLRFAEVTRALRALSSGYVERRETLAARSAFEGAGKRAAYALYYGPLHYLTARGIVQRLPGASAGVEHLADWGCGTGAASAAWASLVSPPPSVTAIDTHPWAVSEAAVTFRHFNLSADVRKGDVSRSRVPRNVDALVTGWVINELPEQTRTALLPRLLDVARNGTRVLVVEPIATRASPWWPAWQAAFERAGGRADEWRFGVELPAIVKQLDKAAGMRHDELTARSLWLLD